MRLYADSTKCTGCNACLTACSLALFGENDPRKAALLVTSGPALTGGYTVKVCTQCGDCASVCPDQAIKLNKKGAFYVNSADCDLCEACVPECPNGVMFVQTRLSGSAWKCDLCGDCVTVCEPGALWIAE